MQALKDELEDLAFEGLWPEAREAVRNRLSELRRHDSNLIEAVCPDVFSFLGDESDRVEGVLSGLGLA